MFKAYAIKAPDGRLLAQDGAVIMVPRTPAALYSLEEFLLKNDKDTEGCVIVKITEEDDAVL